jgi:protein gp37
MAKNTNIEWTHHTANPWWGCTKVHAGCDNCYAETLAHRYNDDGKGGTTIWGPNNPRKATNSVWRNLLTWQAEAAAKGEMHRVFVGSMMDIFEKPMPLISWHGHNMPETTDDLRQDLFQNYVPACPNLMFLFLTKRPSNIAKYIPESWHTNCPTNVMFGTSISTQSHFHDLVEKLRDAPGQRFLSIEPQLDCIIPAPGDLDGIHWVIQGGESGPDKRPFNILWAYDIQIACAKANVPYFFKQIDKVQEIPGWALVRQFPATHSILQSSNPSIL